MSRLVTLQPRRHDAVVADLAAQDNQSAQDYHERLLPHKASYDAALQRRVLERYVDHLCALLHTVGQAGADLVLLPECTLPVGSCYLGGGDRIAEATAWAEPLWLDRTAPIARQYNMLIASCYYRLSDGNLCNDGVLMDERGQIAGVYHKVHLPCGCSDEVTEAGLFVAGCEHNVIETSLGRTGFQICYDIDFPEGARCLALNGADLILHPTVGYNFPDEEEVVGEARLRTRATDNSVIVMYSNFGPTVGRSAIYDRKGNQAACAGRGADVYAMADLDVRAKRIQDWGHEQHDHKLKLESKRRPDTYSVLTDVRPPALCEPTGPDGRFYDYEEPIGLP